MVFPLFTQQMYANLTYKWANTIFACLALLMAPIPFVSRPLIYLPCLTVNISNIIRILDSVLQRTCTSGKKQVRLFSDEQDVRLFRTTVTNPHETGHSLVFKSSHEYNNDHTSIQIGSADMD